VNGRWAALLVPIVGACVGLPPSPPQHDGSGSHGGTTIDATTIDATHASASADGTLSGSEDTQGPSDGCGDGVVEPPEECDLGPLNGTGMYCTDACTTNRCGDGYVGPGEACDDGNQSNEDACTTACGPTTCGDGVIQGVEQCDDGEQNALDGACLPSCIQASCGDTFIQRGVEICDGNDIGAETCASQGFDDGVLLCAADCQGYDTSNCDACGNGMIEAGESCDGTAFEGDVTCQSFAPGGTTVSGGALACTADCTTIDDSACTYCGDGVREGTEVCDGAQLGGQTCASQGFLSGTLTCTAGCTLDTSGCTNCGNGVVDAGEECDGMALGGATCASELGMGYGGSPACTSNCTLDTSGCCLGLNQPCMSNDACCSSFCTFYMGSMVCRP
jgi:cysteine-rich repeat protein